MLAHTRTRGRQSWIPYIRRLVRLLLQAPLCRILLILLGFYAVRESTVPKRPDRLNLPRAKPGAPGADENTVRSGDLIMCNHQSFVDVLFLNYRYAPVFLRASLTGGVQEQTLLGALLSATRPCPTEGPPADVTAAVVQRAQSASLDGPLAIFPEGVRTNGDGLLEFLPAVAQLGDAMAALPEKGRPRSRLLAIQYPYSHFKPTHTTGGVLRHVLLLCFQVYSSMRVTAMPAGIDPQPGAEPPASSSSSAAAGGSGGAAGAASGGDTTPGAAWAVRARDALARLLAVRPPKCIKVALGAADYAEYLRCVLDPKGYKPKTS